MTDGTPIAVFARAPMPGEVKTRLIPSLGAEGAAALHARLVRRTLATARAARLGPVTLWCAPDTHHPFFADCVASFGVGLKPQAPGDLGARMLAAFEASAPSLLIGSDCPALAVEHLQAASQALRSSDAVFLPAEDGGYVLVGLSRPMTEVFDAIPWGGDAVMIETRRRLDRLGLRWSEPVILWDVDRPDDLVRLAASGLLDGEGRGGC